MAYADYIILFSTNVQDLKNLIYVCNVLHSVKGGDSNLGLNNRNAWLLENVSYPKNQSGGLVTNVCKLKNCLMYLIMCLIVVVIMSAMSPID